jgi:hypothetical protein
VAFACRVRPSEGQKSLPDDMPSVFQAATTRDFQYGEAQYGMVADYAVAYEAPDGSRGPWSDVTSVIIA